MTVSDSATSRKPSRLRRILRWFSRSIGALALLVVLFYAVENWRGKRAWENCKRELEAKGAVLDWTAYIPAPVPDEQNILKAPKMAEWFAGKGPSELSSRINIDNLSRPWWRKDAIVAAEVTLVSPGASFAATDADLVLQCGSSGLTVVPETTATIPGEAPDALPSIAMENIALPDAIRNLARQAKLNCVIDPRIEYAASPPAVFFHRKNTTAHQALVDLLECYNLRMVFDPNNLITRITEGGPPSVDPSTREKIAVLLQHALVPGAKPARIFVRTNTLLRPQEMTAFLRPTETHSVQVESDGPNSFRVFLYQPTGVVGWVTLMPLDSTVGADLVLRCDHSVLTIETDKRPARVPGPSEPVTPLIAGPSEPVTPLIVMDDVPLIIAIRNLARQINLEYSLDPGIQMFQCGPKGELRPQPSVSIRWENVTARQALVALLANNGLVLVEHSTTGTPRIYERDPCKEVFAEPAVRQQLDKWWKDTLRSQERAFHGPNLKSPMNFRIALQPPTPIRPTHIALRSDETPSTRVIEDFFSDHSVRIETAGSNAFRIFLRQPEACTAAELLAWSNRLEPDFEVIREGLKRPYAQVGGNYDRPSTVPIPNFVSTRTLAQTLAARAQAHLLVGEPDKALRDLTLLHQMSRLFEAKPAGRPITLVGAMINVAITGLYVQAVADGFQLHAWQEPQLAALQQQLREVNLMAPVAEALRLEQAWPSRTLDITPARELIPLLVSFESRDKSLWEMLKEKPALFTLFCMPRGWKEQNKVVHARLLQMMIESYDSTNQIISPRKLAVYGDEVNAMVNRGVSPYRFIAAMITPSFVRCNQTTARNQTSVNEAAVACALERHRVAHGHYPETLDALAPQFKLPHDVINGQPLKYHRTGDGDFSLYSIGWNETDDGGADIDINNGDWVWPPKS